MSLPNSEMVQKKVNSHFLVMKSALNFRNSNLRHKLVHLWQFGPGSLFVTGDRCLRRGNVHLLGFLTLEKIDFFCEIFSFENRVPQFIIFFFENHISETKHRRNQTAVVSGTYKPRESTPGISAESDSSLGNFPKVLSASFS